VPVQLPARAFPLAVRVVALPENACVAFVIFIYTNYRIGALNVVLLI
jgi:hypothetical protein